MNKKHCWVELKYTPIEATLLEDGSFDIHATESALEISEEEALYACWFCVTPLTADSFHNDDCPGGPGDHVPGMGELYAQTEGERGSLDSTPGSVGD